MGSTWRRPSYQGQEEDTVQNAPSHGSIFPSHGLCKSVGRTLRSPSVSTPMTGP